MTNLKRPIISIIIRTKNEEKWIGYCLDAILTQKIDAEIEVILVDNESTDHTLEKAKRYEVSKYITIKYFLPGKALNDGIRSSKGDYIVCISAHCIPEKDDWLQKMLINFKENKNLAGVYGRQLPLSFTDPIDKRDLLIVFGMDRRVQVKDYFFHNANSMIPRSVWKKFPFDEKVTNIEDRVWGKEVIKAGYKIVYEPEAAVYHHHGLHQGNIPERARGVVSILEQVDRKDINSLPNSMIPENHNVAAVIPIIGKVRNNSDSYYQFKETVNQLIKSDFVKTIYCVSENESITDYIDIKWINREEIPRANSLSLNKLLFHSLEIIEAQGDFPESILYVNYDYINHSGKIFDKLITDAIFKGFDTVFPGLIDYGHYWYHNENEEYKQTDPSLKPREKRDPLYRALYGLGCLTSSWVIRSGQMINGKVGILKIVDPEFAQRLKKD